MKEVKNVPFYPINLKINNRSCVVVGGGNVAERKVQSLLAAGASVTVLSPELTPKLVQLVKEKKLMHIARTYEAGDLAGFFIVICATDNKTVNKLAAEEASRAGALINVVDAPELGNFSVPSQILRGDLLMTISTGGKSPALARVLGLELAERYGPEYGEYLDLVAKARIKMKKNTQSSKEREAFWRQTIDSEVINLLKNGKVKEAEAKIYNAIGCSGTES
ncbi:MAG: bifunctional precorrin-2 dehydrogenase/sirohydrochlorin ferrochelatase [Sporomusaceae bacterium]|nr:bifunctional precorrin-2 dehydrogenase/sirohydrochlorin ferrochelatase [Sporomusaceae bacterium]